MRQEADAVIKRFQGLNQQDLEPCLLWSMRTNEKVKTLASKLGKGSYEKKTGSREDEFAVLTREPASPQASGVNPSKVQRA